MTRLRDAVVKLIADDLAGPRASAHELKREVLGLHRASDGELIGHLERIVQRRVKPAFQFPQDK